jgi:hypothetical protein
MSDNKDDKPEQPAQKQAEQWFKSPDVADAQTSSANQIAKIESTRTNASDGSLRRYVPHDQEQSIEIDFGDKTVSRQNKLTERHALLAQAELPENSTTTELDSITKDQNLPEEKRALASNIQEMRTASKALGLNTESLDAFVKESLSKATETTGANEAPGMTIAGHKYSAGELLASANISPEVVTDATNATTTKPKDTLQPPTPTVLHGSVSRNFHLPPDRQKPNERITGTVEDPNKGALIHPAPEPNPLDGVLVHPRPEIDPWADTYIHPLPEQPKDKGALIHPAPEGSIHDGVLIHPGPDQDTMTPEVYFSKPESDKSGQPGQDKTDDSEKRRRPKPDSPDEVVEALKKELLEMDLIKDGVIPKERGQKAADEIRARLWPYIEDPNRRNIAFFIFENNGKQDIVIGISGTGGPGAKLMEDRALKGKKTDAENKALNELFSKLTDTANTVFIAGYSEQEPCPSCNKLMENRLPEKLKEEGFSFQVGKTAWTFKDAKERVEYARSRMAKPARQWNNW